MDILWNFINENDLKLNANGVSESLICVICSQLLQNASYLKCDCRFCQKCITDYVIGDAKLCPGCLKKGTERVLGETTSVSDIVRDTEISKLRLQCPYEGCRYACELKDMLNHLSSCQNKELECCVFRELGCDRASMKKSEVYSHLKEGQKLHGQMMVDFVTSCRSKEAEFESEMETLKSTVAALTVKLKEEVANTNFIVHEWILCDLATYLSKGDRFGDAHSFGGYVLGSKLKYFSDNPQKSAPENCFIVINLVLYPMLSGDLKWPLSNKMVLEVIDPATGNVVADQEFGLHKSRAREIEYSNSDQKKVLLDSDICFRPYILFPTWENSLTLRCRMWME